MSVRSFLKKKVVVLVLLFLVYAWYFASHFLNNPPANTLGAATNVYVFTQPEAGRTPLLNAIEGAQSEILVQVYLLSDPEIIQALGNADRRGVRVMAMLEEHPFGGGNLNPKSKAELERNGVEVSWSSSSYALTHQKSIVIDGKELFLLNQNLTASAFSKNREYDVITTDPEDVSEVKEIFRKDWSRENFYLSGKSNLIVSPLNSRQTISDLINNAKEKIVVEMEVLADKNIIDLLTEKSKSVEVRIIIPPKEDISSNKKAIEKFEKNGVQFRVLKNPYPHAKLILIDNEKAYVGSVNLSTQSMDENRELGIILTEPQSIVTLYSTFEKDWVNALPIN